jgi:hypothetical protein
VKTSTLVIGGAVVVAGVLYVRGRKQLETASGSKTPGLSLGGVLQAIRAGVKGYSGEPNTYQSTVGRIGSAFDDALGSLFGVAPAVTAAGDVRYTAGADVGPQLSHGTYRVTELSAGTKMRTWSDDAVVGLYN